MAGFHVRAVRDAPATWDRTYRAVYTVHFKEVLYVLHASQKKSPTRIRTAQLDVDLAGPRLKIAQQDYEVRYGKATP